MGRLDVRIVEARNLPDLETFSKPDPYVKLSLENSQHQTSVAENTLNPKWDEVFKFVLADADSAQLEMKLWNKNMVSDDYMGEYRMSLAGLTKGVAKDVWCLLQNCKSNAEIHIRLLAHDFGADAAPGQAAVAPHAAPVIIQQPVVMQQQPIVMQQQPIVMQQPMYQQQQQFQQPQYQQPMMQQQPMYQQQPMMMQQPMMQQMPSATFQDFQFVQFMGPVRRATYGPMGTNNDYTMQVNAMIQRGQTSVSGGIHTAIGDPAPGVPKQFCVWY